MAVFHRIHFLPTGLPFHCLLALLPPLTAAFCAAFATGLALALHHGLNELQLLQRSALHFSLMHKGASWSSATTAACSGKLTVCSKQGLRGREG